MLLPFLTFAICAAPSPQGATWEAEFVHQARIGAGQSLVEVDDLDGDGVPEIAMSITGVDSLSPPGEVRILSGTTGFRLITWTGQITPNFSYGEALGVLPDRDGDGKQEMLIGDPARSRVSVRSLGGQVLGNLSGDFRDYGFGSAITATPDLNGDGVDDFLIGAPLAEIQGSANGAAFLYSGADLSLIRRWDGIRVNSRFGASFAIIDDLDADGVDDVLIGAPLGDFEHGAVHVHSGATGDRIAILRGSNVVGARAKITRFASSMAAIDDLTGDGKQDLVIGAPGMDSHQGAVFVVSTEDGSIIHEIQGTKPLQSVGMAVGTINDLDGDGVEDFYVTDVGWDFTTGAQGRAVVHSGADARELVSILPDEGQALGGRSALALGEAGEEEFSLVLGSGAYGDTVRRWGLRPFLHATENVLKIADGGRIELQIDFPDDWAGGEYLILATRAGIGSTIWGVDVPLAEDPLFYLTKAGGNANTQQLNWVGTLDAAGDGTALIISQPGFRGYLVDSYHFAAVAILLGEVEPSIVSFAVPFDVIL